MYAIPHLPVAIVVHQVLGREHEPALPPVGGAEAGTVLGALHHEGFPQDVHLGAGEGGTLTILIHYFNPSIIDGGNYEKKAPYPKKNCKKRFLSGLL